MPPFFIASDARDAHIHNNRVQARGFGIWLDKAPDVLVERNRITGDSTIRSQDRGNGIHLHNNVNGAMIRDNTVCKARDGIYINVSDHNTLCIQTALQPALRHPLHVLEQQHGSK